MGFFDREIYYYNTVRGFETEKFAARFLSLLTRELKQKRKSEVLFLCIGTDRSTGDSLGPLVGYKLKEKGLLNGSVLGTLEHPVHALNLEHTIERIQKEFRHALVVAVDASIGNAEHIGYATMGRGSLKPGLGVRKNLNAVGDIFITGIVGASAGGDPMMLQSIRLSVVMRLADCISRSILLGMHVMEGESEDYVDNFSGMTTLF